jgi:UDP-glucose 4-epimerase
MSERIDSTRPAVVLGGAGFIGHHLVERLLAMGQPVVVVDDLSRGRREHLPQSGRLRVVHGDVAEPGVVGAVLDSTRPAVVYHLAAMHFIPECVANPSATVRVNVLGTQVVLEALATHPTTRLVFASTADVYAPAAAAHAEDAPLEPGNVYGASKLMGEQLLDLARRGRPDAGRLVALRFFNVYGPGETNPHVLPDVLGHLRRGAPLALGNLEPRRDYVHVRDVADALVRAAAYTGRRDVFNVGTGIGTSVRALIETLGHVLGRPLAVRQDPAKVRPVERMHLVADATRARAELGWTPAHTLADGLADLVRAELGDPSGAAGWR